MNAIATKVCGTCKQNKPLSEFHRRAASPDGCGTKCKQCQRDYDRARLHDPKRVQQRKDYQQTDTYKQKHNVIQSEWRIRHRLKSRAHSAVARALKTGKLIRPLDCEGCGAHYSGKLEAHHDDYTKPLDVKWLCDPCHKRRHIELRLEATPHQDMRWGGINAKMGYAPKPEEPANDDAPEQRYADVPF